MSDLIFGKDKTQRVVGVEPGNKDKCVLFVQGEDGAVQQVAVPMSHWILYTEKLSPKMLELGGDQPFKYLMEYDNKEKYESVLKVTRDKREEHFISRDPKEAFMVKSGVTMFKGLKVKDVSALSFDLEHTYGIGDKLNKKGKLLLISNTYRDCEGNLTKKLFAYDDYKNETEMLVDWVDFVSQKDPTILLGHNLFGHDLKVLRFAAQIHNAQLRLGRDSSALRFDHRVSFKRKDGSQAYEFFNCHCYGREIIDTFFLAINYDVARNYESYGLKQIVQFEVEQLEVKKIKEPDKYTKEDAEFLRRLTHNNSRTFYDASKILENYLNRDEWVKIKDYCIDDADDALTIYDLMIPAFFYSTQSIPRSLQHVINSASGSQINAIMVRGYLQQGHSIARADSAVEYEGAISFGIPGIHKNVLRFDVSSLYPSVMLQYRIFNSTKDPQELFLKMVNYFTEERLNNKRIGRETGDRYYKDLEQSQKILINSMYGFLGANRVNYNYPDGAAEVTRHGRRILQQAIKFITGKEYEEAS